MAYPHRSSPPSIPKGLLALNAVLLALLALVTFAPHAGAQARARGQYTMVAGGVNNSQSSAVYIVDTTNQELMVVTYDATGRRLEGIAYRNLAGDAAEAVRPASRSGG